MTPAPPRHLPSAADDAPPILGESPEIRALRARIRKVGASRLNVLIHGPTGSGKELVALHLHARSGRQPFVPFNCGALTETLAESELFGHQRGAFTGADRNRIGLFEAAHGGSLFLDEVAELTPAIQAKLLRVLENGEIRRVGDDKPRYVDVRVIAATNRDLEREIRESRFREDLFYRLALCRIQVPPLCQRGADLMALARHFAGGHPIAAGTATLLEAHAWPGNVRELKSAIEVAAVECEGDEILPKHLPDSVRIAVRRALDHPDHEADPQSLRSVVRNHILSVIELCDGNVTRAAAVLGIDRRTLRRKMDEYGYTGGQAG